MATCVIWVRRGTDTVAVNVSLPPGKGTGTSLILGAPPGRRLCSYTGLLGYGLPVTQGKRVGAGRYIVRLAVVEKLLYGLYVRVAV